MRLVSRFSYTNQIRRDRPLTHEELMHYVPGILGEDKHTSRSQNYTYVPTITVLESPQREGFQPFFACRTRVRDLDRQGHTEHMLRLQWAGEINGEHISEIIPPNLYDGTSSYQMLPGYFRFVCQNGYVCGQSLREVRVPHRGNMVGRVIERAYEVVGVFDWVEEKHDAIQSLVLPPPTRQALVQAALVYRYDDEYQPVTTADILTPRRRENHGKDLWGAYRTTQGNMLKGGVSGRSAKGERIHTRTIHSIDIGIKLNRALWVVAGTLLESLRWFSHYPENHASICPSRDHFTKAISYNSTASSVSVTTASENNQPQLVTIIAPDEQRISSWPRYSDLIPQWITLEPRVFG